MLPVAVARSSSDDNAICYVLPVSWMTSCFHAIQIQAWSLTGLESVTWRIVYRDTPGGAAKLCTRGRSQLSSISLFVAKHPSSTVVSNLFSACTVQLSSLITFRVSRTRRKMYCSHARLCVCLCVCLSAAACPHYCTDPDVTWGSDRGCPVVVHCWADLQSVHGLRCYGNITRTVVTSLPSSLI